MFFPVVLAPQSPRQRSLERRHLWSCFTTHSSRFSRGKIAPGTSSSFSFTFSCFFFQFHLPFCYFELFYPDWNIPLRIPPCLFTGCYFFPKWAISKICVFLHVYINPRTYTQIHTPTVVQGVGGGGWGWWNPSPEFLICCSILNNFTFSGKPLMFLTRWGIFYGWWRCWRPVTSPTMVAILAAI